MVEGEGLLSVFKRNPVVHVLIACIFIASGLIINGLQALTMILWWKGDKDLYRTLNIRLAYMHWALVPFLSEWWAGIKVKLYMKPEDYEKVSNESSIVVLNHKYDIDWAIGWVIADRVKILGNAKCVAKKQLSYVPLLGWAWRFCEYIFVNRSLDKDSQTILKSMEILQQFKHYYWMLIYCEGTRFTEKKHKQSMEVAEQKGLKPLKHHLLPRTKGFRLMTQGLRDSATSIYDCTIYVKDNKSPTLLDLLQGKSYDVEFLCIRKPLDAVPNNDEDCASYIHEMYQKKDALFDYCTKHDSFPLSQEIQGENLEGFVEVDCPRRTECVWIAVTWVFVILSPIFYYIWSLVVTGAWMHIAIMAGGFSLVSYVFHKILAQGAVGSSSSTYGSKSEKKKQ